MTVACSASHGDPAHRRRQGRLNYLWRDLEGLGRNKLNLSLFSRNAFAGFPSWFEFCVSIPIRCMVWKSFVGHDDVPCVQCGMEISMSFCVCGGWGGGAVGCGVGRPTSLFLAGDSRRLTWVRLHLGCNSSVAHSYRCVQKFCLFKQCRYGCFNFSILFGIF